MKTWIITARIRKRGAIGLFWNKTFSLEMPEGKNYEHNRDEFIDEWFRQYGKDWELSNFVQIESERSEP